MKPEFSESPVLKAVKVLQHLAREEAPVTLADLSQAVGLPKPTTHRLAGLLEQAQLIHKDPLTRRYAVGRALEELALNAMRNGAGHASRRFHMDRLSEKLGERINLGVLSGGKVLYVEWVESTSPLRVDVKPGSQVPVHCSANGKLLIASSPPVVRSRFLRSAPFDAYTKTTITTTQALARELERIRRQGYSEDNEEFLPGVCCLAVPVRNRRGDVVAGLAVMAPSVRFPLERARSHLLDLEACAEALSAELGAPEPRAKSPRVPQGGGDATIPHPATSHGRRTR